MPSGCESARRIDAAEVCKPRISYQLRVIGCTCFQEFVARWEGIHELHVAPGAPDLCCPKESRFHGNPTFTRGPSRCWLWIPARSEREKLVCALGEAKCVAVHTRNCWFVRLYEGMIYSPSGHPKCGWVYFFIRFGEIALHHLLTSGCSAVNGCRQNDSW